MKKIFDMQELQERIELNFNRLKDSAYYQIGQVFSPPDYEWYGDKEGRALLAFVCHYKQSGRKIPCMDEMMRQLEKATDGRLFFGPPAGAVIHEEQLSGHSWLLRGLAEYYEQFSDPFALQMLATVFRQVYLPTMGRYHTYPVHREARNEGNVSGNMSGASGGWALSTDVGCAFMSIDGLSHAYAILKDAEIKTLLDEMIEVFLGIDKVALRVQTHCTLSAARGMMRLYGLTGDGRYLAGAKEIYGLYTEGGMTLTYQNVNWWGRNDTWTEPCAIVDSLMLALELYLAEGEEHYRRMAVRIYHNGLATAQRANGGAGTDSVVTRAAGGKDTLFSELFEAYFCCTMRLAEGLWYIAEHASLLGAETTGSVVRDENGVYMDRDILYAEITGEKAEHYFVQPPVAVDGHLLHPLLKYHKIPKEDMESIRQRVIF